MPSGDEKYVQWRYIPCILLIYSCGIAAVYKRQWDHILSLLVNPTAPDPEEYLNPHVSALYLLGSRLYLQFQRAVTDRKVSLGQYVKPLIRPIFHKFIVSDEEFRQVFDLFEMLLGFCYLATPREQHKDWMPLHDAIRTESSWSHIIDFWVQRGQEKDNWALIQSDFLQNTSAVEKLLSVYQKISMELARQLRVFLDQPNYLAAYQRGLGKKSSQG